MKFLYYTNITLLAFTLTVLIGELKLLAVKPHLINIAIFLILAILILGIAPYQVRSKNPYALEFGIILLSIICGVVAWF